MEPIQSTSRGDGATLLGATSCPLKVAEGIWFRCCSCTYVTKDQLVIVSHLAAHGDQQSDCQHPSIARLRSQVFGKKNKGEKPLLKCKFCPREFVYNYRFGSTTTRTHTGEKPLKLACNSPKAFSLNSLLQSHNRTHTNERPFKCKQCPLTFAQNYYLRNHSRTHSGEKPFKCQQCPKAFAQASSLRSHNQTHTGEKPLKCKQYL
uniref:Putative c2h2-type zn-finger protein n=1 Tax=Ixodes ricinus TaxID=34613 RepID=A0A0K8RI26_IXORI